MQTSSQAPSHERTTWAASVPMDQLAQAIAVAVGVQPVRQLPAPALLKEAEQQQQVEQLNSGKQQTRDDCMQQDILWAFAEQETNQAAEPCMEALVVANSPVVNNLHSLQQSVELQSAAVAHQWSSSVCITVLDCNKAPRNSTIGGCTPEASCDFQHQQQPLRSDLQVEQGQQSEHTAAQLQPTKSALFDDMDDVQSLQPISQQQHSPFADCCCSNSRNGCVAFVQDRYAAPGSHNIQHWQQQQHVQQPGIMADSQWQQQEQPQLLLQHSTSPDALILLTTASPAGSYCSSMDAAATAQAKWVLPAGSKLLCSTSPRSSLDSSCLSDSTALGAADLASSRSSSECSTSSSPFTTRSNISKRVSWGPITEHQLPVDNGSAGGCISSSTLAAWLPAKSHSNWVHQVGGMWNRDNGAVWLAGAGIMAASVGVVGVMVYNRRNTLA